MADLEQIASVSGFSEPRWSPDEVEHAEQLCREGESSWNQFRTTGQLDDLDSAIASYRQVLPWTLEANHWACFSVLGAIYNDRYSASGALVDLDKSIDYYEKALSGVPKICNFHAAVLYGLGVAYKDLSNERRTLEPVELSIAHYEELLDFLPEDKAEYVDTLHALSVVYSRKYRLTDSVDDMDRAESYTRKAFEATPLHNGILRATHLGNIGVALTLRFNRSRQIPDLEEAIQCLQQATENLPVDDEAHRPMLARLGDCFGSLFQRTNQINDLQMCIRCNQQALETTPKGDPDSGPLLGTLGFCFVGYYVRNFQIADIYRGIDYYQQAVDSFPISHPQRFFYLTQLGLSYSLLSQSTNETSHLEKSICLLTQCLESTPADHTNYGGILINLGLEHLVKLRKLGKTEDAENAIECSQRGLDATPRSHPYRSLGLWILGSALAELSRMTASPKRLKCSIKALQDAATCSAGFPNIRIFASVEAVNILIEEEQWSAAANTLDCFFEILPEIILPKKSRDDLQYVLGRLSGSASLAASVYLKDGRSPVYALQALEKARGIISNLLIDTKSDVSILKENYPKLWSRYTQCQQQIAALNSEITLGFQGSLGQDYGHQSNQLNLLYETLQDLRDEIRRCPGLERFLLSLSEDEIRALARNGPVICFNVNTICSEAFIVTERGIDTVLLPALKDGDIQRQVRLFASRGNPARRDATLEEDDDDKVDLPPDLLSELQSIWDCAVGPVFRKLGITGRVGSTDNLPQIWWVGGGMMTLAPLHAAGNHSPGSLDNTLSHAVSSYAPTLRSLQFGQATSRPSPRLELAKILIVSMPTTPGSYKQLNVVPEVASIMKQSALAASVQHLERPTREEVLSALKSCTIAHFACHGRVDGIEPANSALILGRDTEERVIVADFDANVYEKAQIAYLSACSTAEIRNLELVDEGIHLASTFLHSGFQHVIGTLWGADDGAAVEIAGEFYRNLAQHSENGEVSVARALHDAVIYFRNKTGNNLEISKWAPFIHLGN